MNALYLSRRRFLLASAAYLCLPASAAETREIPHNPWGKIEPADSVPDIGLSLADGTRGRLRDVLRGKVAAVQFIFTGCSSTCPLQGAIFQALQSMLEKSPIADTQLLSISIDPANDSPVALSGWLKRFDAKPGWLAVVPEGRDIESLKRLYIDQRNTADNHVDQVFVSNRSMELVWKTGRLPTPLSVYDALRYFASH
ncbi:SCO family protein [Burkholderia sp. BKH01]|nr:SCO family protein [Burkholderia sp. BKH01]